MPRVSKLTLTGKSGTKYTFEVYPRYATFAAVGAVYVLSRRTIKLDGTGDNGLIYIGETDDLSNRPLNHYRKGCFDKLGANALLIYATGDANARLEIETDLKQAYSTPCNQ